MTSKNLKKSSVIESEVNVVEWARQQLVDVYGYSLDQIRTEVPLAGDLRRRADIVVYADKSCKKAIVVVECKSLSISDAYFRRALRQASEYAESVDAKYIWATARIRNAFAVKGDLDNNKWKPIANIPKVGEDSVGVYSCGSSDHVNAKRHSVFALTIASQEELVLRLKAAFKVLWYDGAMNMDMALNEFVKVLFCKIEDESRNCDGGGAYAFQITESSSDGEDPAEMLLRRITDIHEEIREELPTFLRAPLQMTPSQIKSVAECLADISILDMGMDARAGAFGEFLRYAIGDGRLQASTPRRLVEFIVTLLPLYNDARVIDPSCGIGDFLIAAARKTRVDVCGLDVSARVSELAKINTMLCNISSVKIELCDSLLPIGEIARLTGIKSIAPESFDFVLMHPPFGIKINTEWREYIKEYELSSVGSDFTNPTRHQRLRKHIEVELMLLEQGWRFLRAGGWLAVILPQGVLFNSTLRYARQWLMERFRIAAIVALPRGALSETGTNIASSVVLMRKRSDDQVNKILLDKKSVTNELCESELSEMVSGFLPNESVFVSLDDNVLALDSQTANDLAEFISRVNTDIV